MLVDRARHPVHPSSAVRISAGASDPGIFSLTGIDRQVPVSHIHLVSFQYSMAAGYLRFSLCSSSPDGIVALSPRCYNPLIHEQPGNGPSPIIQKEGRSMKETIQLTEYANLITAALPKGILLSTDGDKYNSMVIGWGHLGVLWGKPTFHVYVRQGRYTKGQLDKTGEFTVSVPLEKADPAINRICGFHSGFDIDKAKEASLQLEEPLITHTPGVRQYPLTLECRVLYSQDQDLSRIPADIREKMYPQDVPGTNPMANRDFHTMYVGEVLCAYIIR